MKTARVYATFPELKGNCYATGTGIATTARAAISRAFEDIFSQTNVRGKRFSNIEAKITISARRTVETPIEDDTTSS